MSLMQAENDRHWTVRPICDDQWMLYGQGCIKCSNRRTAWSSVGLTVSSDTEDSPDSTPPARALRSMQTGQNSIAPESSLPQLGQVCWRSALMVLTALQPQPEPKATPRSTEWCEIRLCASICQKKSCRRGIWLTLYSLYGSLVVAYLTPLVA